MTGSRLLAVRAALAATVLAGALAGASARTVYVTPMNRTAGFQFWLSDDFAPSLVGPAWNTPKAEPENRALLEWRRQGDTGWKKAQDFVRTSEDARMVTMLFGLNEGEVYEYRVRFEGPAYTKEPITGSFRTRSDADARSAGPTVSVPVDSYTDIRSAVGWALWQGGPPAGHTVVLDAGKPGRTVLRNHISSAAHPYYHYSHPWQWSGEEGEWITLKAQEGQQIVFDGSNPAYDVVNEGKWVLYTDEAQGIQASHRIFRTKAAYYWDQAVNGAPNLAPQPVAMFYETAPGGDAWRVSNISRGNHFVGGGVGSGQYEYESKGMPDLKVRAERWPDEAAFVAHGGYVYLRMPGGRDPNDVYMKIPSLTSPLDIHNAHHVRFEGFTFQYFNGYLVGYNYPHFGGIDLFNVHDILIKDCTFKAVGSAVSMHSGFAYERRNIVMRGCTFTERGLYPEKGPNGTWTSLDWNHVKHSLEETTAINFRGDGCSVLDSTFEGYANGISSDICPPNAPSSMWEVDNNFFYGISDDAVEFDTAHLGMAVTRNKFRNCYKGVSQAPLQMGPEYVLRNDWLGLGEYVGHSYKQAFLKMGNDNGGDDGLHFAAHNTIININQNPNTGGLVGLSASGAMMNITFLNNYVASDLLPLDFCDTSTGIGYPQIFDGNYYRMHRPGQGFPGYTGRIAGAFGAMWGGAPQGDYGGFRIMPTFADWRAGRAKDASPWPTSDEWRWWVHDLHGAYDDAPDDPTDLEDPFNDNIKPRANSRAIGRGVPLANISYDCGPAWDIYNEAGDPTAGAVPYATTGKAGNQVPTVTVDYGVTGQPNMSVPILVTYKDADGTVARLDAHVTGPDGREVPSTQTPQKNSAMVVTFTPATEGTYVVSATAIDNNGGMRSESSIVEVGAALPPPPPPTGSLKVKITANNSAPKPGDTVVYTITCHNPTDRVLKDVVVKAKLPVAVMPDTRATLDGQPIDMSELSNTLQADVGQVGAGATRTILITAVVR